MHALVTRSIRNQTLDDNSIPPCSLAAPYLEGLWTRVIAAAQALASAKHSMQQAHVQQQQRQQQQQARGAQGLSTDAAKRSLKAAAEVLLQTAADVYFDCDTIGTVVTVPQTFRLFLPIWCRDTWEQQSI